MFTDEADARAVIKQYCAKTTSLPNSPASVELIVSRLRPQFWIEPVANASLPAGRTHFGGAPELPKGATWPLRPVPADAESRAAEFNKFQNHTWAAASIVRELPFEFIAQIDLAVAARHQGIADGLPNSGRLHFFWDSVVGIFVEGAAACKVIWDDTPAAAIEPVAVPPVFAELELAFAVDAHASFTVSMNDTLKALPDSIKLMRSAGITEADLEQAEKAIREQFAQPRPFDPNLKKPYVYPRRVMQLTPILHLPHARSAVVALDKELDHLLKHDDAAVCYLVLTSRDEGPFTKESSGLRRQRFLGTPDPEQDDPLYSAIDKSKYPEGAWSEATIQDASRQASAWQLLLQIDCADLAQVQGEGTVYFIIRRTDLARRDFSQVHAYYQQT
jgi:hypothetical protein